MVSEETARRIAAALERLAVVVERQEAGQIVEYRPHTGTAVAPYVCYRCIPSHVLDWANPCRSHRGNAE